MKWIIDEIRETSIKSVLVIYINLLEQYDYGLRCIEKCIEEKTKEIAQRDK